MLNNVQTTFKNGFIAQYVINAHNSAIVLCRQRVDRAADNKHRQNSNRCDC